MSYKIIYDDNAYEEEENKEGELDKELPVVQGRIEFGNKKRKLGASYGRIARVHQRVRWQRLRALVCRVPDLPFRPGDSRQEWRSPLREAGG